jgi:hypothetical protein
MGRVRSGDKDFEDYDSDEDEREGTEQEEEQEEIRQVQPKINIVKTDDRMVKGIPEECEEPGCNRPATKTWKGRKVCADHYDFYRDKEQSMYTFYY